MKSHEYAKRLHEIAEFLESRPEFETPMGVRLYQYTGSKSVFMAAARSMGSLKKEYIESCGSEEIRVSPAGFPELILEAPRSVACRIVKPAQPAVYDCEPFLSQAEESEIEPEVA